MAEGMKQISEKWKYDVFLSFRGEDVRKNFLSHLNNSLRRCGIRTFLDDTELERGESISPQLLEAIETSKILIVILSQNYASSAWCLDELLHIMKGRRSNPRQLVFPIFFYVDPSDVRRQKGSYDESLSKHIPRYPQNKLKEWKEALTEVGNLSGWDMRNWDEAKCIEDITSKIHEKLPCQDLHVPSYAVGMGSRLEDISSHLSIGSDGVKVIGICGMGGIGKTTLAKVAFNEFSHRFEGSSFLENFTEYSKKPEGITQLKQQLCSDILKSKDIKFNSLDHALKERFRSKSVLIVIDDVDDKRQLDSAAIDLKCFGRGSRIIITTRNMHLLTQLGVEGSCSPKELNPDESLELLSWHAFRTSEPPKEFRQLSEKVVEYCAGLPLALEVLGAFLIGRLVDEWECTLEKLKMIPPNGIQGKLRISFDALDSIEKNVFLDIACFFIGRDRDYVACILDGCKLHPGIVLKVLMERCLITVRYNIIMMHDLLRDMGRQIVQEKFPDNCGERSRLWDQDDVISVLTKDSGTKAVVGLSLKVDNMDLLAGSFDSRLEWVSEHSRQEKKYKKVLDLLLSDSEPIVHSKFMDLEVENFAKMQELRLLELSCVNLKGSYAKFPKDLRWLSWHGFSSEYFPTSLNMRSLVVLDMQYSNLKRLWEAPEHPQVANMLKYLDLSYSSHLTETPDFSYFPNLEKLLLIDCKSLVLVHKSIGILHKKLVLVNLSFCTELVALPKEFYKLVSLETLILTFCVKLERLDDALGELESLTTLAVDFTFVSEIPSSINQLKKLKKFSLMGCKVSLSDDIDDNIYSGENPSATLFRPIDGIYGFRGYIILSQGYCNLKSLIDFQMKRSKVERTSEKTLEGWVKMNRGCIYVPEYNHLQNWVSFKEKKRSFAFTVPENHNSDPAVGFTLWTRIVQGVGNEYTFPMAITVKNNTGGGALIHSPKNPWIISNLLIDDFRIERGDQMEVDVYCDDNMIVLETGFAFSYKALVSSDLNLADTQFIQGRDDMSCLKEDSTEILCCSRREAKTGLIQAEVIYKGCSMNGVTSDLYAGSIFKGTSWYQENNQTVKEERHLRQEERHRQAEKEGTREDWKFLYVCHAARERWEEKRALDKSLWRTQLVSWLLHPFRRSPTLENDD